jgi:hypothetical protein
VQPIEGFAQWQVGKDYIAVCYMALLRSVEIALHYDSHSILDLFAAYKLGAKIVADILEAPNQVLVLEELLPAPII